jgi:uncharacterized protein YchJ
LEDDVMKVNIADELLDALEHAGRTPDLDLIRTCLERREELTPGLLEMLASGADPGWDDDDPRWYREIHAGLLLIAFREPAALPIFTEIYRDEEREVLWEWFDTQLPAYGPLATQWAIDLLNDDTATEYGRGVSTEILTAIALNHPDERERIVEALRAQLPPLDEDGNLILPDVSPNWTWVASALASLRDTVSQPQIVALYEAGLMDEFVMGDLKAYLAHFKPDAPEPLAARYGRDVMQTYEWLHRQAAQEAEQRAKAEQRRTEQRHAASQPAPSMPEPSSYSPPAQPQTFVRSGPKVGRNDPCPCGSGRKYKHCCMKKQR